MADIDSVALGHELESSGMGGDDRVEVPTVERRDLGDLQPFRDGNDRGVGDAEREALVPAHQVGHPAQVPRRDVALAEVAGGDRLDEVDLGVRPDVLANQVARLGDYVRRDQQFVGTRGQQCRAAEVVGIVAVQ
jgi:hypothetical protein